MGLALQGCGLVPAHEIPIRDEYIQAGVQPGDKIEVTTDDGTRHRLLVTSVGSKSIESADESIAFEDIDKLVKRSWSEPDHPCGGCEPVGCSFPSLMMLVSDVEEFATQIEPACIVHDFCYRHGYATYGTSQDECDRAFYANMAAACVGPLGIGVLDPEQFAACELAAAIVYDTVRQFGKDRFRRDESTFCEYDLARSPAPRGVESHVVGGLLEDVPVGPGAKADH